MTNLLTPLKKLGKKLTGKDISGTNLVTVVDDIANKYDGSGGGSGGGGDNGNVVLKFSEGILDDIDLCYDFPSVSVKDLFDALSNGYNVFIVNDLDNGIYISNFELLTLSQSNGNAYYRVQDADEDGNRVQYRISFDNSYIGGNGYYTTGTLDEWFSSQSVKVRPND